MNTNTDTQNSYSIQGPWANLALHTIGWKSFQDLCAEVCQECLDRPVEIYQEANDGGQDAVFLLNESKKSDFVGTVQCKYVSDPERSLRASDITDELIKVEELVKLGQAHTYIFITNISVNAKAAVEIRNELKARGVNKPHIFGKQFLVRVIRSSSRLRALVPQVYGLGDLSTILDERALAQAKEMLEHWTERLKAYVPTAAHGKAVKSIEKHGVVLLLGNPASGKSAIGAILSTITSDSTPYKVIFLNNPAQFDDHWNPNDEKRFFWIDDAFGANKLRKEFVDDWTVIFPKIRAALKKGNRFLFTSRSYIYRDAERILGTKNLVEFSTGNSIVNVGNLTAEEKSQILYNHIKFGNQSSAWKSRVKNYLPHLANVDNFLPGISERLGDTTFTKNLLLERAALVRFMEEPTEHLVITINSLDNAMRSLLILVYAHRGKLKQHKLNQSTVDAVVNIMGVPIADMLSCIGAADGSFIRSKANSYEWEFAHPTIFDALTVIISNEGHMTEAIVRGAQLQFVLSQLTCHGMASEHRTTIPKEQEPLILDRLSELPEDGSLNDHYLQFMENYASDELFESAFTIDHDILSRKIKYSVELSMDPIIGIAARAFRLGLLNEENRRIISDTINDRIIDNFDYSIFEYSRLLDLIEPNTLMELGSSMKEHLVDQLIPHIESIGHDDHIDLDVEASSHFDELISSLNSLELSINNVEIRASIDDAYDAATVAESEVQTKKDDHERELAEQEQAEQEAMDWHLARAGRRIASPIREHSSSDTKVRIHTPTEAKPRSIFSDVEK